MGTMKSVKNVAAIKPPMVIIAMGERISAPSLREIAIGSMPSIIATVAIIIGSEQSAEYSRLSSNSVVGYIYIMGNLRITWQVWKNEPVCEKLKIAIEDYEKGYLAQNPY